jgi:hypothetical protein
LVPFFILMVVVGSSGRNTHDSDKEIEVNTYQGEKEGMEGDESNENDSNDHDLLSPISRDN